MQIQSPCPSVKHIFLTPCYEPCILFEFLVGFLPLAFVICPGFAAKHKRFLRLIFLFYSKEEKKRDSLDIISMNVGIKHVLIVL